MELPIGLIVAGAILIAALAIAVLFVLYDIRTNIMISNLYLKRMSERT